MRAALRAAGASGYRLHRRGIPGRPDIAFMRWKVAVFVDGAYWHGHPDHVRPDASPYWVAKIERNRAPDMAANEALVQAGWTVVRLWDLDVARDLGGSIARLLDALQRNGWSSG